MDLVFSENLLEELGVFARSTILAFLILTAAADSPISSRGRSLSLPWRRRLAFSALDGAIVAHLHFAIPPEFAKRMMEFLCASLLAPGLVAVAVAVHWFIDRFRESLETSPHLLFGREHRGDTDAVDRAIDSPSTPTERPHHYQQMNLFDERDVSDQHED